MKTAIVTGAARGIGREIALRLLNEGINVAINDLEESIAGMELPAQSDRVACFPADVGDFGQAGAMVAAVMERFGSVDILVNNAGILRDGYLTKMNEQDFDDVIRVNLKSVFNCSRHVLPHMMRQKYGRIVSLSSMMGIRGNSGQTNYAASKAGVIGFTKALAKEVAARGITVNALAPGFIRTDMTDSIREDIKEAIVKSIPAGDLGTIDDVAEMAVFLAGEKAGYITGQVISMNGGYYC
ncbi:MAG: 3-oxoacyl-[acyl-carrier-protein] reductase [Christensenellaceae bacterium]|jgi:3-oxoacyl-[acyl-carrier protein] reductase